MPPAVHSLIQQSLPLPMVAVLILQTAGFVWLGADKYTNLSMRISVIERVIEAQVGQRDRIIILEQSVNDIREDVRDIKTFLRANLQINGKELPK